MLEKSNISASVSAAENDKEKNVWGRDWALELDN